MQKNLSVVWKDRNFHLKGPHRPLNKRIYHECEGGIEKLVLRITIWHHEAGRVVTNGDLEGQIIT